MLFKQLGQYDTQLVFDQQKNSQSQQLSSLQDCRYLVNIQAAQDENKASQVSLDRIQQKFCAGKCIVLKTSLKQMPISQVLQGNLNDIYVDMVIVYRQIDAELWYLKSLESFDKDEQNKTIEFIDKALNLNPQSDVYWNIKDILQNEGLGRALRNLNKNEEAIQCLNVALQINPKNDYAWNNKGSALRNLNQNQEAIQCLNAALQINPNNELAWNNKGSVLNQLTKYDEAIQCLDATLKINPNTDSAWNNKGDSLNQLNRFEEAVRCYDESLNLKSKFSTYIKKSFPLYQFVCKQPQNIQTNQMKPKLSQKGTRVEFK